MSGGAFEYAYLDTADFSKAEDLLRKLYEMRGVTLTAYPDVIPYLNGMASYIETARDAYLEKAPQIRDLLQSIEWCYSGDSGPDDIYRALEILKTQTTEKANAMADVNAAQPDTKTELIIKSFEALHGPGHFVWTVEYERAHAYIVFSLAQTHVVSGLTWNNAYEIAGVILARHRKFPDLRKSDPLSLADAVHSLDAESQNQFFQHLIRIDG
jgi:hypothetical protein